MLPWRGVSKFAPGLTYRHCRVGLRTSASIVTLSRAMCYSVCVYVRLDSANSRKLPCFHSCSIQRRCRYSCHNYRGMCQTSRPITLQLGERCSSLAFFCDSGHNCLFLSGLAGRRSYCSSTRQGFLQVGGLAAAEVLAAMGFSSGMAFGGGGIGAKLAEAATTATAAIDSTTLLQQQASVGSAGIVILPS